jgi:hypothetical protein
MVHALSHFAVAVLVALSMFFVFRPPSRVPKAVAPTYATCVAPPDLKLAREEYNCQADY